MQNSNDKRFKIGIMGGTFDPIHYAHLLLAEEIRQNYHLDKVYFVPSGTPPHKNKAGVTDKYMRYEMVKLACEDNPYFEVSRIETDATDTTYTIDTIKKIEQKFINNDVEIFFITGADAIMSVDTWKSSEELLRICKFIGATRAGVDSLMLKRKVNDIIKKYDANIYLTQMPDLAISSTDIRNRVKNGRSIKYLLPDRVAYFIADKMLYR